MATVGKLQFGYIDSPFGKFFHLFFESGRIHHDPIADHAIGSGMQDPAGNQMQNKFFRSDLHRMAGIVPALIADDHFGVSGQDVDDFAFAFIPPLHSY